MTDHNDIDGTQARNAATARLAMALTAEPPPGEHLSEALLAAWLDQDLGPQEVATAERHIAQCDRCYNVWSALADLDPATDTAPAAARAAGAAAAGAVPAWWRRLFARPAAGAMLGAAAAVVLAVIVVVGGIDRSAPLGAYGLEISGQTMDLRGAGPGSAEVIELARGNRLELLLKPNRPVEGDVVLRAWLVTPDGASLPVDTGASEVTERGVIRYIGVVGTDVPVPGQRAELIVVVSRDATDPTGAGVRAALATGRTAGERDWNAWRIPVELAP